MKSTLALIGIWVAGVWLVFMIMFNSLNPDSRFCMYQIYRQDNGTYQVWFLGRTRQLELSDVGYEQAKEYQTRKCRQLIEFMSARPHGERVK